MNEEGLDKTSHDKIFIAEPLDITTKEIKTKLNKLNAIIEKEDVEYVDIKNVIKEVVPTFKEPDLINKEK